MWKLIRLFKSTYYRKRLLISACFFHTFLCGVHTYKKQALISKRISMSKQFFFSGKCILLSLCFSLSLFLSLCIEWDLERDMCLSRYSSLFLLRLFFSGKYYFLCFSVSLSFYVSLSRTLSLYFYSDLIIFVRLKINENKNCAFNNSLLTLFKKKATLWNSRAEFFLKSTLVHFIWIYNLKAQIGIAKKVSFTLIFFKFLKIRWKRISNIVW